jgi:pSer/pThr/pTyr-binding forkhead associated (FHA) protein
MNPRLAAVAGPKQGTMIPLDEARTSVGRDPGNQIRLPGMAVSRRHCLIEKRDGEVTLTDLGSHNGTFVNGVPVKERRLEHGDQVRVGESVFLFLLRESEIVPAGGAAVELKEQGLVAGSTVELSATPDRAARDLDILLRISTVINSIRGVPALQRRLLESIYDVVPAERGAVLLAGKGRRSSRRCSGWRETRLPAGPSR